MDHNAEQNCLTKLKKDLGNELDEFQTFMDDGFLMHFVRGKKYNHDKALKAVRGYWDVRKNQYNFVFQEINDLDRHVLPLKSGFFRVLKTRDSDKRRIVGVQFENWPEGITSTDDLTRTVILLMEELWNCVHVEIQGVLFVVNLQGFGWEQIKVLTPLSVYRLTNIFWNNMPLRYKAIHLMNAGSTFLVFLKTVKYMLPKTMRERLIIHEGDLSKLHVDIPSAALPNSLGGSLSEADAYDDSVVDNILRKKSHYDQLVSVLKWEFEHNFLLFTMVKG